MLNNAFLPLIISSTDGSELAVNEKVTKNVVKKSRKKKPLSKIEKAAKKAVDKYFEKKSRE